MTKKKYTPEEIASIKENMGQDWASIAAVQHTAVNCPFCGKEPEIHLAVGGFLIECKTSKCVQPCIVLPKIESALERWNRRD